ncbi:MAG: hypothetical protein NTW28_30355, partial [Candidatus Solibacter sp.]|nr:hypothetical protein [Candidatus Solibacter sp.]
GDFKAYDKKTGKLVLALTSQEFWGRATGSGGPAKNPDNKDPRMLYDPSAGRWYASSQRTDGATNGSTPIVFARSDTDDPTGGWKAVPFLVDPELTPDTFCDFDVMGYNADAVYLSINQFTIKDKRPMPAGTALFSIKKSDLNQAEPVLTLDRQPHVGDGRDFAPVLDYDGKSRVISFLARITQRGLTTDAFLRHDIAGDAKTWKLQRAAAPVRILPGVEWEKSRYVATVAQPGGRDIAAASGVPTPAPLVNGEIWLVYTVALPEDPKRSGFRWLRMRAADNTIVESGILWDPKVNLLNPSIAADALGNVVVGGHGTGPENFVGAYAFAGRLANGTVKFDGLLTVKAGAGDHNASVRWGDYTVTLPDVTAPGSFWLFQATAQANGDWAMQISQLVFPRR